MHTQTMRKFPGKSLLNMSINELLYYVAFSFYTLNEILVRTKFQTFFFFTVSSLSKLLKASIILLLFTKFMIQKSSIRTWLVSAILVATGFISWRQSGEGWLFWLSLFVICAQGVKLRPLAAISLGLTSFMLVVTITSAQLGFIQDLSSIRANGFIRHALGFTHPNFIGIYLLFTCISFSVLNFGKVPVPDIFLLCFSIYASLNWADSRTSALLCIIQIVLLLIFYVVRNRKARNVFRIIFISFILFTICISYYLMIEYNTSNKLYARLDSLLSGRLRLAHSYYEMQDLTLFGSNFEKFKPIYWEDGQSYTFVVDNSYCHLLLRFGIIPSVCFLACFIMLLLHLIINHRWDALLFGLVMCSLLGFSETYGIRFETNYFLYAIGSIILYPPDHQPDKLQVTNHN